MHPFGGSPVCPTCSKPVYAAEQVMGPGRKLYHKPCLSCMICKKRLDSSTLLEHDQEPYCKSCYARNFGTRDLRQANLPARGPSVSSTPTSPNRATDNTPLPQAPPRVLSPVRRANTGTPTTLPSLKPTYSLRAQPTPLTSPKSPNTPPNAFEESQPNNPDDGLSLEADEMDDALAPLAYSSSPPLNHSVIPLPNCSGHRPANSLSSLSSLSTSPTEPGRFSGYTFGKSNNTTSAALTLLEKEGIQPLVQTPTGTRYGAALGGKVTVNMTGTPTGSPRKWGGGDTPLCPKCSQRVYFAEQVKAVGKTWHKNCLRCRECNTMLDSNRLRDHDGDPFCVRCYSKLHGPQGSGYALLGKAGG